jgi:hypothetical protein
MARQVILISSDAELATDVAAALSDADRLTVLDAAEDLSEAAVPAIATVVVDLPAEARRAAYDRLRASYDGEVVMLVDPGEGSDGLPEDPARRVLARPVQAAELIAGLPALPALAAPEEGERRAELARVEGPGRLVPDEVAAALWPAPSPPARSWRPLGLRVGAGLVVLLVGGAAGFGLGDQRHGAGSKAATATSIVVSTTVVVRQAPVPPACPAALGDADAAISYLVGHIRDQRLVTSLKQYQDHSRACRQATG